jgi:hypothetical protein
LPWPCVSQDTQSLQILVSCSSHKPWFSLLLCSYLFLKCFLQSVAIARKYFSTWSLERWSLNRKNIPWLFPGRLYQCLHKLFFTFFPRIKKKNEKKIKWFGCMHACSYTWDVTFSFPLFELFFFIIIILSCIVQYW